MRCREFELLLCDYLDEQVDPQSRREMDAHRVDCASCEEALADAEFGLSLLRQASPVEPPAELIGEIIHSTVGVGSGRLAPAGGGDSLPGWLQPFVQPFLQPRFVMGMAMTAMSFSLLTFYGERAVEIYRADRGEGITALRSLAGPATDFWDQSVTVYDSAVDFYQLQMNAYRGAGEGPGEQSQ
ncbi:MAG: hypothetical protein O2795_16350 [Acidobacteria bacterium]|nr:hypothetical protein [Acidobacteriota bacterium]